MPREEHNTNKISRKRRLDNSSTATSCDGANNNNNNREFRQRPWFRLAKIFIIPRGRCDKSSGAEFQNSMCDIDLFFSTKGFQTVWLSSSRVTRICCLISEKPIVRIWQNLVKKSKKLSGTWKQRGCHNIYRRGVLSLHRIVLTKPFIIALTLIHKLQDIFTFVLVIAILCCFHPFRSNYG